MRQQASEILGVVEQAFSCLPAEAAVSAASHERARRWADALHASHPDAPDAPIALSFAIEMLLALPAACSRHPDALRDLVDSLEATTAIPRSLLGRLVFAGTLQRSPEGEPLERQAGLERALALTRAIIGAQTVSLWQAGARSPTRVAEIGDPAVDQRETFATVIELLAGDGAAEHASGATFGVRLTTVSDPTPGALVCTGAWIPAGEATMLLAAAGTALTPILALSDEGGQHRAAAAAERQLTRLRFDLHDGPLQDVMLLAEDLRLFGSQLESALSEHPLRRLIIGRLDDLKAMLVALDGDLRRIASLLESPFLRSQSFPEALAQLTGAFAQRTEVIPIVSLEGAFDNLTDSQHITLLGLIREALSNIREHSDAAHVTVTVIAEPHGLAATVTDDGSGFDPETALIKAAREGHLGLVGMHERVRMLGGSTRIDSRPGGPTVISVSLPRHAVDGGESAVAPS